MEAINDRRRSFSFVNPVFRSHASGRTRSSLLVLALLAMAMAFAAAPTTRTSSSRTTC